MDQATVLVPTPPPAGWGRGILPRGFIAKIAIADLGPPQILAGIGGAPFVTRIRNAR